jgi:hypothetical protein
MTHPEARTAKIKRLPMSSRWGWLSNTIPFISGIMIAKAEPSTFEKII